MTSDDDDADDCDDTGEALREMTLYVQSSQDLQLLMFARPDASDAADAAELSRTVVHSMVGHVLCAGCCLLSSRTSSACVHKSCTCTSNFHVAGNGGWTTCHLIACSLS